MMKSVLGVVASVACGVAFAAEGVSVPTAFRGNTLLINNQETKLGTAQWAAPEKNWQTTGELLKTALPPSDAKGGRPNVILKVALADEQTPWGGLKCLLMAASALGVRQATVEWPDKQTVALSLPGGDPAAGEVVDLPLFAGQSMAQTENGGQKMNCTAGLLKGLVGQLPGATVSLKAEPTIPAVQVVVVLRDLQQAKATSIAYLPVKEITARETAERKEAKDAVDRSFGGLERALGGKKD
jgi:hypothetical protein